MANLRVALLLLVGLSCVAGLLPGAAPARGAAAGQQRAVSVTMAGAAALAKKTTVLEGVKENMDGSALMFCVRSEGLRVNELNDLRMKLPEGVRLQCVKNTLVNIAAKDFEQFNAEGLDGLLHYSNYWFFATEAGMRDSIKVWKTFTEESGRKARSPPRPAPLPHPSPPAAAAPRAPPSPISAGGLHPPPKPRRPRPRPLPPACRRAARSSAASLTRRSLTARAWRR